ncbi:MAG TPA: lysophospholipid acyltransferase family protein [Syntrophobacteria bacterium]|nr:lysophospholipid acyltransferase family protein [Syntrophobacteria bacterium]
MSTAPRNHPSLSVAARRGWLSAFVASIRPRRIAALGSVVGQIAYYLDFRDRPVVWRNVQFCFPEWTFRKVVQFSKRVYQHLGVVALETLQTIALRPDELIKRVEVIGSDHLLGALEEKRGVLVLAAHTGNWEVAMLAVAASFHVPASVVSKVDPLNRFRDGIRRELGIHTIDKRGAFPGMLQALRQGHIVVIAVDRSDNKDVVEVQFFGRRTAMTMSAALLALRCRCPVVPAFCHRKPDGGLILRLHPAFKVERSGDLRADLQVGSQRMSDAVEAAIRRCPEQWLWPQKRWKVFYPHLYPEYLSQRKRRQAKKMRQRRHTAETSSPS